MRKRALVFDSGLGGLSVVDAIVAAGLDVDIDYLADNLWLPYGDKSDAALVSRVPALTTRVADQLAADALILACNTASTIALDQTRAATGLPVIGVVPPIKPAAAATQSGVIGLLATPATIGRQYIDDLVAKFADGVTVIRCGPARLVAAAEAKLRGRAPDPAALQDAIDCLFGGAHGEQIDVVAMGCTHYPLLTAELSRMAPRPASWLDSGAAIAARLAHVLALTPGEARLRRACFTDARAAADAWGAFEARGFSGMAAVGREPAFETSPITSSGFG